MSNMTFKQAHLSQCGSSKVIDIPKQIVEKLN